MNHRFSTWLFEVCVLAAALFAARPVVAQPAMPPGPDLLMLAGTELERERVVPNAPYCADAMHETVQTLADGNRIVHKQTSRLCRDAQGRTRQEVASGERRRVYLRDPVAGEAWMLDPQLRHAIRLGARPHVEVERDPAWEQRMKEFSREMREWAREMGNWGREFGRDMAERMRRNPPGDGSGAQSPQAPRPPQPPMPPEATMPPVAVRIVIGEPRLAELPPLPGPGAVPHPIAFQARVRAPRGPGITSNLPPETIEGLRAEGKRTTWTVEAGKIGNEKPIVITREIWTSPELQVTLRSRDVDPLTGESNYRLQNLTRAQPDAALFKVPAEYTRPGRP